MFWVVNEDGGCVVVVVGCWQQCRGGGLSGFVVEVVVVVGLPIWCWWAMGLF